MRSGSDEAYVVDLCDTALGRKAVRGHRFSFLVGDTGAALPVDAYYPDLDLVVEYRERQHSEAVTFFDKKLTCSGVSRGAQRIIYDQRRRDHLPTHGITLVELDYSDFPHDSRKRLKRTTGDLAIVSKKFEACGIRNKQAVV
jgi:hypothetical protein